MSNNYNDISQIKTNSLKLSMLKIPFTFAMFLTALLPFIAFSFSKNKFKNLSMDDMTKINAFCLLFSLFLFITYIILRFIIKRNIQYKYSKKDLKLTIIFYILMFISVIVMYTISFLMANNKINTLTHFLIYGFGFILCALCSVCEFASKISLSNFSNLKIIDGKLKDVDVKIKLSDGEETVIKK